MYTPFRRSSAHFQALCEVFGQETTIALCRQLAPKGDRRRIPVRPNPRLMHDLGEQAHHANRLCYHFPNSFVYFPFLVETELFDSARSGMTWEQICDRYQLRGMQLNLLLGNYLGTEARKRIFPKITKEMIAYISHPPKERAG